MESEAQSMSLKAELAPDGSRLFKQNELADWIARGRTVGPYNNPLVVRTVVSRILSRTRTCPEELVESIISWVEHRYQRDFPQVEVKPVLRRIREVLRTPVTAGEKASTERLVFEDMVERVRDADTCVMVLQGGLEAYSSGRILMQSVVESVVRRGESLRDVRVCVPGCPEVRDVWSGVRARLKAGGHPMETEDLEKLNEGGLRTFVVPPVLCAVQVIVSNPDMPEISTGWCVFFQDNARPSICTIPSVALEKWRSFFYSLWEDGQLPVIEEIRFGDDRLQVRSI